MTKRQLILIFLVGLVQVISAQTNRYNANWVFGHEAGIKFHGNDSTSLFRSKSNALEHAASISDSNRNLTYYTAKKENQGVLNSSIFTDEDTIIENGEDFFNHPSHCEGSNFLRKGDYLYLFHTRDTTGFCNFTHCRKLFYSLIRLRNKQQDTLIKKN